MTQMSRIHVPRSERQCLIGRARVLRRTGKTYDEIRAALGVEVSDDCLKSWLRGIPRPPETRRTHRLDELRRECRRLRAEGLSYTQISLKTGASKGSISPWVRDIRIPPPPANVERPQNEPLRRAARKTARERARRREVDHALAACSVGPLNDRELFLAGVALYWAEGSKSKTYDLRERIVFVNSDATVIGVFLRWLRLLQIPLERCRFRVAIHETADISAAHTFWSAVAGLGIESFQRPTIKRHRPKTNRLNQGDGYHGCLVINVLGSAEIYRAVAGWWAGLHAQATNCPRRSPEWSSRAPWLLRGADCVREA
jgi:hypothetical protein